MNSILSDKPLVSVIIPTYNFGSFLLEAVSSVQSQTYTKLEIIIIDDGSTDNTTEILDNIDDQRVTVLQTQHMGVSAARNAGIKIAKGEYIAFLDADDRWLPRKIELQLELALEKNIGGVFCNFRRFNENGYFPKDHFSYLPEMKEWRVESSKIIDGAVIIDDAFKALAPLYFLAAGMSATLLRHHEIKDIVFPENISIAEDWHYMLRVYERYPFGYINDVLLEMRRHGKNSYQPGEDLNPRMECLYSVEPFLKFDKNKNILRQKRGRELLGLGYHNIWRGSVSQGIRAFSQALAYKGARKNAIKYLVAFPAVMLIRHFYKP